MKRKLTQIAAWFVLIAFAFQQPVYSLPAGYEVISGDATFEQIGDNTLNITASQNSIINYTSFNIAENEIVNFFLPSFDAFSLNRILGDSASQIFGTLNANGNLMLVNTSGIHFGSSAEVNVGGLVASAHDISNANFLSGNYLFSENGNSPSAFLLNEGLIAARDGGFAVLAGSAVENRGTIQAPLGTVALAAGDLITVGISADGMVSIGIDEATAQTVLDENGNSLSDQIKNSGTLSAASGMVSLSAKSVDQIFEKAVNLTGVIRADSAVMGKDGVVELATDGVNQNSGEIHAKTFIESGYTFRNTETGLIDGGLDAEGNIVIGTAYYDNIDGAADISGNIGSNQSDVGDLNVTGNITLTANNLTFTADSDNNGVGRFFMNNGTQIDGSGSKYNLTLKTGQNATLTDFVNMGTLTLDRAGSNSTPTYGFDISGISIGGLTIESNVTLSLNGTNLGFDASAAVSNNGTFKLLGSETLTNVTNLDVDSGTVLYVGDGSGGYTLKDFGATDYYNLVINSPGDDDFDIQAGNLTVAGALTVTLGMLHHGAGSGDTVTVAGLTTVNGGTLNTSAMTGGVNLNGGLVLSSGSITAPDTLNIGENFSRTGGTFDANNGTVVFNKASGTQTLNSGGVSFSSVTRSGAGTLQLVSNGLTATQGLTIGNGTTLDLNGQNLTVSNSFSNNGTFRLRGNETVTFNSTNNDTDSGTWEYVGDGDGSTDTYTLKTFGTTDYFNLLINMTDASDVAQMAGTLTLDGALSVSAGTLYLNGQNIVDAGGGATATLGNIAGTIRLQGSETVFWSTNDTNSGTWEYVGSDNDSANNYNIIDFGGTDYYNLVIKQLDNSESDTVVAASGLSIANNFTVTSYGTYNANGNTTTVGGATLVEDYSAYSGISAAQTFNGSLTINNNSNFTITSNTVQVNGDFSLDSSFDGSNGALDVNGNFTLGANANVTNRPANGLFVSGNYTADPDSTITSPLIATFDGAGTQTLSSGGKAFQNFTHSGSGTLQLTGYALSMSNTFTNSAGIVDLNGQNLTVTNGVSNTATIRLRGSETINFIGASNDVDSGTWEYVGDNDGAQDTFTIKNFGSSDFFNLTINSSDTGANKDIFQLGASLDIDGALTITSGILSLNGNNIADISGGASATLSNIADTLRLNGTETVFWTTNDTNSGTYEYVGRNIAETLSMLAFTGTDYYNLVFNDTNTNKAIFASTGGLEVAGALTVSSGSYSMGASSATVTGLTTVNGGTFSPNGTTLTLNGGLTMSSGTFNSASGTRDINGDFNLSGGTYTSTSGNMTVSGNFAHSGGTFTHNSGTVTLDGGNQTISGSTTFYNLTKTDGSNNSTDLTLTFDNTGTQTIASGGTLTLTGIDADDRINLVSDNPGTRWELTCSTCTLSISWADVTDSDASGGSVITNANTVNGGHNLNWQFGISSTWTGSVSSVWSLAGNWSNGTPGADDTAIIADVTTDPVLDTAVSVTSLTISTGGLLTLSGYSLTVSDTFSNSGTVRLRGDETISLTQDIDSGTWEYVGDGDVLLDNYTVKDFGATDYYNLIINASDSLDVFQSSGSKTVAGAMTVASGDYDGNSNSLTVTGLARVTGGNFQAGNGNQTYNGGLRVSGGNFTGASNGFIDVNGDVLIDGGSLTASGTTGGFNVSGDWSRTSGSFSDNTGTITFDKATGTQTLNAGGQSFYSLAHTGAGTLQLVSNSLTLGQNLTNSAGVFDLNGQNLTVTGAEDNTATIRVRGSETIGITTRDQDSGLYEFVGDGDGSADTYTLGRHQFMNLAFNSTDANDVYQLNSTLEVDGSFDVTSGILSLRGNNIQDGSGGTQGVLGNIGGTIRLRGNETVFWTTNDTNSGTWEYTGDGDGSADTYNLTFAGSSDYFNLTINSTDANDVFQPSSGSVSMNGAFTVTSGIYYMNGGDLEDIPGGATASLNNIAGTLRLKGNETVFWTTNDTDSGTWEYVGNNSGTSFTLLDFGGTDYYNLVINATNSGDSFSTAAAKNIAGAFTLTSGTYTAATATTVTGLATVNGGTYSTAGTQTFNGGLTISSGSYSGGPHTTDINGNFTQTGGTFTAPGPAGDFSVSGNFAHTNGTFTHSNGTVTLDGGNQTISGSTTFYNLTKTDGSNNSTDLTLTFDNTGTQTIANGGTLTLTGIDADDRINLVSDSPGTRWELTCVSCTRSISWADVTDSDASGGTAITHSNTVNGGNNLNWSFSITSNWTGAVSSVWSLAGNWSNGTPGSSDTAIIDDVTNDPILDTNVTVTDLTISAGGLLSLAGYALTVSGTFSNNGTVQLRGSETLSLTQDINSGTWRYLSDGDAALDTFTIKDFGATDYYNLIINSTDAADIFRLSGGGLNIAGAFTLSSGVFNGNGETVTAAGLATVSGGTYQSNSAAETFNGGLTISGGAYSSSTGGLDINGNLTVSSGTFDAPNTAMYVSGNVDFTGSGTFNANSGTVIFDGTTSLTSNGKSFNSVTIGTSTSSGSLTLADNMDINVSLSFDTTGGTAVMDSSSRTVNYAGSTLNLTNADTFTTTGSTWIFDGTTSLTSAGKTFNNVTIGTNSASGSLTLGDTTDINGTLAFNTTGGTAALVATNRTVNYAGSALDLTNADTFTTTGSTFIFDGTTSLTSAGKTFNNVTIGTNTASGSLTLADTADIDGTLTFNTTFGIAALDVSSRTVNYAGGTLDLTNADTFTTTGSTWIFDGTTSLTSSGEFFNNITIGTNTASGSLTLADTTDINGTLSFNTTGGTTELNASNRTVNYAGGTLDLTNADTFTTTGSTWIFDGTTALTSDSMSFNNITVGTNLASGSLTLSDTADINGTLAFNTTGGTASLDATNRTVNYAGSTLDLTNADTFTSTGSTFVFDGTTTLTSAGKSMNNVTIGSALASGALTLADNADMNGNLTFNTAGGTATLDVSNRTVNFSGSTMDLTGADTFTNTGSTWIFDGITALTTNGNAFNNITIGTNSASGSLTLSDSTDINGTLSFNTTGGTTTLNMTNTALYYSAGSLDFTNLDTLTSTGSTFVLDGAVDQAVTAAGKSFHHFTVNNTGVAGNDDVTLTGDLDVNGAFNLTDGNFHAPGVITVAGDFYFNGGAFDANNGLVTLDTTTAAIVNVNGAGTGSIDFFDFSIIGGGKSVTFGTGDTFNILSANTWTVTGDSGNNVSLNSSGGGQFNINPAGTNLTNTTISNANNTSGLTINCGAGCVNGGGNTGGWSFPSTTPPASAPVSEPSEQITNTIETVGSIIIPGGFENGPVIILIPENGDPVVVAPVSSTPPVIEETPVQESGGGGEQQENGDGNGNGGGPGGDPDGGGGGPGGSGKKTDFQESKDDVWDLFNQVDRTKYKTVVLVYEGKVFVQNFDAKGKSQGGGTYVRPNMKASADWDKDKHSVLNEPEAAPVSNGCVNGEGEKCKKMHTYKE